MKKHLLAALCAVVLLLTALSAQAAGAGYVTDRAGLLDAQERDRLDRRAQEISETYQCGLYIVTVEDYRDYGAEPFDAACNIYRDWDLGVGDEKDGLILLLSMDDRDYATAVYGPLAHSVFTDDALAHQEPEFLDDFGDNDWYEGFSDFLTTAEDYLAAPEDRPATSEDHPVTVHAGSRVNTSRRALTPGRLAAVIVQDLLGGVVISLVICLAIKAGMKSVRKRATAEDYAVAGGENLSVRTDQFTHATQTRHVIQTARTSGGGGGSRSHFGGGFSGRSGKF